ncbi:uncharacterized protein B0H18DRAFT_961437 [Fomitopsis serialis]|uniref:uncharacterized protein n=1 Tax=Fomitopsis serialis TaxID=139415 RepID=UPI0020086539|nr:uncharacterized protein B0H18DRAFT_961437 [Neoantrodia serialis]KAH9912028.1 hypothetical protein B0H18DRAFT_961437 [Neoantrodia serialis]
MDRPAWSDRIRVILEAAALIRLIPKHTEKFLQELTPIGSAYGPLTINETYQRWHEHMKDWLRIIHVRTITDPQPLNMLFVRSEIDRLESVMIALANVITPLYRNWSVRTLPESLRIHTHDRDEWTHIARSTISLMHLVRETVDYWHIDAGIVWQDPPIKRILYDHHPNTPLTSIPPRKSATHLLVIPGVVCPLWHINCTNEYEFFERICAHIALLLQERQLRIDREIEFDEEIDVWVDRWLGHLRALLPMIHEKLHIRCERPPPIWLEIDLPRDRAIPDAPYTLPIGQLTSLFAHPEEIEFWDKQSGSQKPVAMPEPPGVVRDSIAQRSERVTLNGVNDHTYRGGGPSPEDVSKSVDILTRRLAWFNAQVEFYQQCNMLSDERSYSRSDTLMRPEVSNYLRKVALEAGHHLSERDVFVFTDHPPRWDDWTEEDLILFNRMLRALYNSPVSFKWWDAPAEGAWKEGLDFKTFATGWRNLKPKWWGKSGRPWTRRRHEAVCGNLAQQRPAQPCNPGPRPRDEDDPHSEGYEINVGRVTGEDCRKAQRQAEIYLAWKAKGRAPAAMAHPIPLSTWARPLNVPPQSQDTVNCGRDRCERCTESGMEECRVPAVANDPRCVTCRARKKGCSFGSPLTHAASRRTASATVVRAPSNRARTRTPASSGGARAGMKRRRGE